MVTRNAVSSHPERLCRRAGHGSCCAAALVLASILLSSSGFAQTQHNPTPMHAMPLQFGTLLTTARERAELDRLRDAPPSEETDPVTFVTTDPPSRLPSLTLQGIIRQDDGQTGIWVSENGSLRKLRRDEGRALSGQAAAIIHTRHGPIRLKVGQTLDMADNSIHEVYTQARQASTTETSESQAGQQHDHDDTP